MRRRKYAILNLILMLTVVFAVSYQSLHIFSHHSEDEDEHSTEKSTAHHDDCKVCGFEFTAFLSTEFFTFSFYNPHFQGFYFFSNHQAESFFCGSLFALRAPPFLS